MTIIRDLVESSLLPRVEKPMRYVGNELNIIRKDLNRTSLHGVLCFPEIYDIGMSHHGGQILYHIVNSHPTWTLSRCYHPWIDAEEIMRAEGIPLYTLEYFSPVSQADWIGFSVQYELQFTNLLNMLDLAGIPVLSAERNDSHPLVIAGGPCVANPQPLADFVDAFVIGDGEQAIVAVCRVIDESRRQSRGTRLALLSRITGVYIPSLGPTGTVRGAKIVDFNPADSPVKPLVPLMDVVHHRLAVEVMRGCTRGCRFCSAGTYYRPVRERDPHDVQQQIEAGIAATGWRELGLLSLSTADYSCLSELLDLAGRLRQDLRLAVSLPSTRIDALSREQFAALNAISGASSFTIAPEAGSARLRSVINKEFTDDQIADMARLLLEGGVQTLKLYFMIGLPTETMEDIGALVELVKRVAGIALRINKRKMVNVSISPFSPKPHTPFQWEAMDSVDMLLEKSRHIKGELSRLRNVKVSYRDPWISYLETVTARGDRILGRVILRAWKDGARFDGWEERFDIQRWIRAAQQENVDLSRYTNGYRVDDTLPWSGIMTGVTEAFLRSERDRAYAGVGTDDCRTGSCSACGACEPAGVSIRRASVRRNGDVRATVAVASEGQPPRNRFRYRIVYAKGRQLRYLGHHDLMRIVARAFVAAKVTLEYSQGYKPQPRIGFGPPLPMGVMGARELFDVYLTQPFGDWERVGQWLPEGLMLQSAELIAPGEDSINESVVACEYEFVPIFPETAPAVGEKIAALLGSDSVMVADERKAAVVERDLRPLIHSLSPLQTPGAFQARLSALPGKTCRPSDLLSVAVPQAGMERYLVTRSRCILRVNH